MDYSAWTMEQLRAKFVELGQQYAAIGTVRSEIDKEMKKRERIAAARVRLSVLNGSEKDALKTVLTKG